MRCATASCLIVVALLAAAALSCGSPPPAPTTPEASLAVITPPIAVTAAQPTATPTNGSAPISAPTAVPQPTATPMSAPAPSPTSLHTAEPVSSECPLTLPVPAEQIPKDVQDTILAGMNPPDEHILSMHGNDFIWVVMPKGAVVRGTRRESGVTEKFITVPRVPGTLTAEVSRLDGPAPKGSVTINSGWTWGGPIWAFSATFPMPGCWQVTQRIQDKELRFIVKVIDAYPLTISEDGVRWIGPANRTVSLTRSVIDSALPADLRGKAFDIDQTRRLTDMSAGGRYAFVSIFPDPRAIVFARSIGTPAGAYVAPPHPCYISGLAWLADSDLALVALAGPDCGRLIAVAPDGDVVWEVPTQTIKQVLYVSPDETWAALDQRFPDATDLFEFVSLRDPSIRFVVKEDERPASVEHGITVQGIDVAKDVRDFWLHRGRLASTVGRSSAPGTAFECPVTRNHMKPNDLLTAGRYGKTDLWTTLWPEGTIVFRPGGPGFIDRDGSLGMKWPWTRGDRVVGKLTIEGRRLDADAPPLRANIPEGYGDTGFQSTSLVFPTEGCWEVTGRAGGAVLTFVTLVVNIGEGPAS